MKPANDQIFYFSRSRQPILEILEPTGQIRPAPFSQSEEGRRPGESCWQANPPQLAAGGPWRFRVNLGGGSYDPSSGRDYYSTYLRRLWLQDGQIFDYQPAATVSPGRVIKLPRFTGRLSPRALYIYLPRGYAEHETRRYPVLYMHDGQNCFEAYAGDSFAGSWQADRTADQLIDQGRMRECIIVAVSNGGRQRQLEYLPPYATYQAPRRKGHQSKSDPVTGAADQTLAYYQDDVAPFIHQRYRILGGRAETATCGSSLGGLFSTYIAWERPEFARHHAILSPSYWLTRTPQGAFETIERLRQGPRRDLRLWLDSGTLDAPGRGNDGMPETLAARQALLDIGYKEGPDFRYYLAKGAIHHESAWAARLPLVFEFLFPFS